MKRVVGEMAGDMVGDVVGVEVVGDVVGLCVIRPLDPTIEECSSRSSMTWCLGLVWSACAYRVPCLPIAKAGTVLDMFLVGGNRLGRGKCVSFSSCFHATRLLIGVLDFGARCACCFSCVVQRWVMIRVMI